ncbi:patatin-like phospholipase family protein [Candidatus Amoebophilus asiaticus]|nr:patatin-like phospholipase family protein [Candidatus Amoebophilus asiaticus]
MRYYKFTGEVAEPSSSLLLGNPSSNKKFRILSIDGGGIRGIIPARILQGMEEQTGKHIFELFDVVIGTSTGSLLSLALVTPNEQGGAKYKAGDVVGFYRQQGPKIFYSSWVHNLYTGWGLWRPRYNRKNLDAALAELLGDVKLSQTLKPALSISYSLDKALPHVWATQKVILGLQTDHYLKDIAGATSAAPTYFAPKVMYDERGNILHEVDGGIWANNPEFIAIIVLDSMEKVPDKKDIIVVSIGTGVCKPNIELCVKEVSKLQTAGILGWMLGVKPNLIEMMMSADSEWSRTAMSTLYPHSYRLQIPIPQSQSRMDDSRNIDKLGKLAEEYIIHNKELFKNLCANLLLCGGC